MSYKENSFDCLVIGAGIAGLAAAGELKRAGIRTAILERSIHVGGRLSTIRFGAGLPDEPPSQVAFDHGAQYFTARDGRFLSVVENWLAAGIAGEWSRGFATSDGSMYRDGQPRYRGTPDMSAIPEHLADNLDVRLNVQVAKIQWLSPFWRIHSLAGPIFAASTLIVSTPIPITLSLLEGSGVDLPGGPRRILQQMEYEPCIALMLLLDGPSRLPQPGGMWSVGEPISWISDNYLKGVSSIEGAITIHAGPEFSESFWTADEEIIAAELAKAANQWLGSTIVEARVVKWRHSKAIVTYPEPCLVLDDPGRLILIGDAFAGPRVEGAFLSGLSAADLLI